MSRSYRLVLCDLDGTLLTPERTIHPGNAKAMAELSHGGVRVGLATGRPPRSAAPYVERAALTGPLILFNGAMVWDVDRAEPVHQRTLPAHDAVAIVALALEHGERSVHINVYVDDEIWIARVTETSRRSEEKDGVAHRVMPDLGASIAARVAAGGNAPVKLMLIDEVGDVMRLCAPIRAAIGAECELIHSEPTYLEVLPAQTNKGTALEAIFAHYGIAAAETIAFGDQLNDIELLSAAGLGVAMANADPAVKDIADAVIGPNTGAAIAEYLRRQFEVRGARLWVR